jgi:di/tripeptidase
MTTTQPQQDSVTIAARSLGHLESVVAQDSASDERSDTIPSTPGQAVLAQWLGEFLAGYGACVEHDAYANVIATFAGRGTGADAAPLALLVHADTARGTLPVPSLEVLQQWDGTSIPYPENPSIQVSVANYADLVSFLGQDLVFGPGNAPFGLDDKLGMAHLMTLAWLLATNPDVAHPPLLLIARPDEEIGRMEALTHIADLLEARGVKTGYTIDGIEPYTINVENFNAMKASVTFVGRPLMIDEPVFELFIGGVNTHGATAKAEGHRPAPRLVAELVAALPGLCVAAFESDEARDCDAKVWVHGAQEAEIRSALDAVVGPHIPLGASWRIQAGSLPDHATTAAAEVVAWVGRFLGSAPGFTLAAEDSEGFDGYSQPYRALPAGHDMILDVRLRDFDPKELDRRADHVRTVALERPCEVVHQYVNMGPRLADRPELITWAQSAAVAAGVEGPVLPIRGGTGVDPFLDRGTAIANLGTGYFAPESEKEFTSRQLMDGHARWLFHLVQIAAA